MTSTNQQGVTRWSPNKGRGELVERPLAPIALTDALWIVTATDPGGIPEPVRKRLVVIGAARVGREVAPAAPIVTD